MKCPVLRADSSGVIQMKAKGIGYCLIPAAPATADNADRKARPGSFPVSLNIIGGNDADRKRPVTNSHCIYLDSPFSMLEIEGCEQNDCWQVFVLENRGEGVIPAPTKTRVPVRIADSAAVPQVSPTLATDGYALRPGLKRITLYYGGTARAFTYWFRQIDGTWFNSGEVYDTTIAGTPFYDTREIAVPADRVAIVASGAGATVVVEGEQEAG